MPVCLPGGGRIRLELEHRLAGSCSHGEDPDITPASPQAILAQYDTL